MNDFHITISTELVTLKKPFNLPLSKGRRIYAGVYVMRGSDGEVIYVGKSGDVAKRLKGHKRDSEFFPQAVRLDIYETNGACHRDMLETYLINELKPIYNRSKTYFRAAEYGEEVEEIEYEIGELAAEIDELRRELDGLSVNDLRNYDRDTLDVDRQLLRDEIADKAERVRELQADKHAIISRTI